MYHVPNFIKIAQVL